MVITRPNPDFLYAGGPVVEMIDSFEIDYRPIIASHLARTPSTVRPNVGFTIPMSQQDWRALPRMPGWKYEYVYKTGAETQIRPFGPYYRIPVVAKPKVADVELRELRESDSAGFEIAFAKAFSDYVDYLYCSREQLKRIARKLLDSFFSLPRISFSRDASCIAIDPCNSTRIIGAALLAPQRDLGLTLQPICRRSIQNRPLFTV